MITTIMFIVLMLIIILSLPDGAARGDALSQGARAQASRPTFIVISIINISMITTTTTTAVITTITIISLVILLLK